MLVHELAHQWFGDSLAVARWKDVWLGAVLTAALFTLGKSLIGLYLGRSALASTYGAASSFVILLLWLYYSSQVFLLGAEMTRTYAELFGERPLPDEDAVQKDDSPRCPPGSSGAETGPRASRV